MKSIVLIGPSGVGKTAIGNFISKKLDKKFIDTDELIEKTTNRSISNIFKNYGEKYFRNLESKIIDDIYNENNIVISTGGGTVLKTKNLERLKINGIIFLLYGQIETIVENISHSSTKRPLIDNSGDIYERVKDMLIQREKIYKKSADYIVSVDNKKICEIGNEIIYLYKKHLSCSNRQGLL